MSVWPQARPQDPFPARVVSVKPRSEFATRRNWGLQSRDLKTFSVRLAPQGAAVIAGPDLRRRSGEELTPRESRSLEPLLDTPPFLDEPAPGRPRRCAPWRSRSSG